MRGSRILTGAVIAAAAVSLPTGSAFAEGSLDISPERVIPGQTVTVTAMGCGGQGVGSTIASLATFPLTPIPGSRPLVVTGTFRVKDGARPGEYTVRVSCPQLLDSGAAADPGVVQELFSQVVVNAAAGAQRDTPAAAPARDTPAVVAAPPNGQAGRTREGGGSAAADGHRDGGGDSGRQNGADSGGDRPDEGGHGRHEAGADDRREEGAGSGGAGRHEDGAGSGGAGRHEDGAWSGGAGRHEDGGGQGHGRPHDSSGWQGGGGWSHHGPHTGVGGAFGMDATETAAGAALLAAAAAGGIHMARRRGRQGNA